MAQVALLSPQAGRTYDGMELSVRSPWYRSLPLSCVDLELHVDGAPVEETRIRLCVDHQAYALSELHELIDEFWFVLDPARVRISGISPGSHEVFLRLGLRIPYLYDEESGDVLQLWSESAVDVHVPEAASA